MSSVIGILITAVPVQAVTEGELLIWMRADKSFQGMRALGEQFEAETGVPVRVEVPEAAIDKFIQAAQRNRGPDLLGWAHDRVGDLVTAGLVQPVNMTPLTQDRFLDKALQAFTIQGDRFGYPVGMEAVALIYNRDLVPDPPQSFAEVRELHEMLTDQGKLTLHFDYRNFYFAFPLLAAQGGYIFGQTADGTLDPGDVGLDQPGAIAGLEMLEELVAQGVILQDSTYSIMVANMVQQDLGLMITGPWEWSNLEKNEVNFGVAPLPSINGHPTPAFVGVQGFLINQASPNADLIQEFMEHYVLTPEGLQVLNQDVPVGIPSLRTVAEAWSVDPRLEATLKSVEQGVLIPNIPEMNAVWTQMSGVIGDVVNGRINAEDALIRSTQQIEEAIE
jgi:maltose/maltodextrin transport system substrate-binding protein